MAVTAGICDVFKLHLSNHTIDLLTDTFKCALFDSSSVTLDPTNTSAYSTTGEISGTGYTAGGQTLTGVSVTQNGDTIDITWTSPSWATSTITADTALIYDSTTGDAIAIIYQSGGASSSNGTFTVTFPSNLISLS